MSLAAEIKENASKIQLPRIEGDSEIQFDILTHKSIRHPSAPPPDVEEYGSVERLTHLGRQAFQTAASFTLFNKQPRLSLKEWSDVEATIFSDGFIKSLVEIFGVQRRIRYNPVVGPITNEEELAGIWYAWFGAVFIRSGFEPIKAFTNGLIDPQGSKHDQRYHPDAYAPLPEYQRTIPSHMMYSTSTAPPPPQPMGPPPAIPPPPSQPPPMQSMHSYPHMHMNVPPQQAPPRTPLQHVPPQHHPYQQKVTLALFNERASQIGFMVTYPATMSGPAHAPVWVVRCCVNGQEKGIGQGRSQKVAKEQAAQMAWQTLGFT